MLTLIITTCIVTYVPPYCISLISSPEKMYVYYPQVQAINKSLQFVKKYVQNSPSASYLLKVLLQCRFHMPYMYLPYHNFSYYVHIQCISPTRVRYLLPASKSVIYSVAVFWARAFFNHDWTKILKWIVIQTHARYCTCFFLQDRSDITPITPNTTPTPNATGNETAIPIPSPLAVSGPGWDDGVIAVSITKVDS